MQALVLAGGEGTRLRPLTYTTPKPVMPLAGRPFLSYALDWLGSHGVDEVILFHRLALEHMAPIVDIQVARVQKLLKDRKIVLDLTDAAKRWLGRVGYDPVYGARPLKRAVQRYVQDPLADKLLAGEIPDGSTVKVDEGDGELKIAVA